MLENVSDKIPRQYCGKRVLGDVLPVKGTGCTIIDHPFPAQLGKPATRRAPFQSTKMYFLFLTVDLVIS